jgi:hypothetical protein
MCSVLDDACSPTDVTAVLPNSNSYCACAHVQDRFSRDSDRPFSRVGESADFVLPLVLVLNPSRERGEVKWGRAALHLWCNETGFSS